MTVVFRFSPPRRRRRGRQLSAEELIRRVGRIAVAARKNSVSQTSGDYRAIFHGRGMEFSEVREYRPGDDVRSIDWNVTARAGAPYVKLFREERDRTLLFLIDLSASEDFGSTLATKRDLAAEATAAIAISAAENRDRVGAILFTDRIEKILPPARGRPHALSLVRDVLTRPLVGFGTDLPLGIRAARNFLKSRALVVLISDFRASGYGRELGVLARRHDVVALCVSDPAEHRFPARGLFRFRDAETGETRIADASSAEFRRHWSGEPAVGARQICLRSGVDFLELSSDRGPSADLAAFFRSRPAARTGRAG